MNFSMPWRRLAAGTMLGCLTLACCIGCSQSGQGGDAPQPGQAPEAAAQTAAPAAARQAVPVPERKPVTAEPAFTFKFGDVEGKAYELKGVDFTGKDGGKKVRTASMAILGDSVFLYEDCKPIKLLKVNMKGEALSDLTEIGDGHAINNLTGNGRVVLYQNADAKLAVYDGAKTDAGAAYYGELPVGCAGDGRFYSLKKNALKSAKLEGAAFADEQEVFNLDNSAQLKDMKLSVYRVDGDDIFALAKIKSDVDGAKKDLFTLIALDRQGQEVCRYTGFGYTSRDWAVTVNYVVASDSSGQFRVFDRASGNVLGEFTADIRPLVLRTVTGNDVLVYDEKSSKLYRFDF